uniref:Uncharacterized protein n=1 Tax=Amphimedon queenslandica TaxID=400682 RepID=A0A1X7TVS7_AMPQE
MNKQVEASAVQELFEDVNTKLPLIKSAYEEAVCDMQELSSETAEGLKEIRKNDRVKKIPEVKTFYQNLSTFSQSFHEYLDKVNKLYQKLQDEISTVTKDVEREKYKSTEELIAEIHKIIQDCKLQYKLLLGRFKNLYASCDLAKIKCEELEKKKENLKETGKIVKEGAEVFGDGAAAIVDELPIYAKLVGTGAIVETIKTAKSATVFAKDIVTKKSKRTSYSIW